MTHLIGSKWMPFLLRGIVALVVGILAVYTPALTLLSISLLFAFLAVADGIALIVSAIRTHGSARLLLLAGGILGTVLGLIATAVPGLSLLAITYLIAGWAIGTGVSETITAWRLRSTRRGEWLWIAAGVLSIAFGVFVALQPAIGLVFLVYAVSAYAFLSSFVLISLAFRIRALETATGSAFDRLS